MKKRISCVVAMTAVLALLIGSVGVLPALGVYFAFGDVDANEVINAADAAYVLLYVVGKDHIQWDTAAMDVDEDEEITALDATRILLHCIGKAELPPWPPEEPWILDNVVWITVEDRENVLDDFPLVRVSEYAVIEIKEYKFFGSTVLRLTLDVHDKDNVLRVAQQLQEWPDIISAEPEWFAIPA